ncbi:MAG: hypothetical protein ACK5MZ_06040, partial [Aestuariibaculum sp.]
GNMAENFNIIFKTTLMLINNEKSYRKSKKSKRLRALMDRQYREKILFFKCFCPVIAGLLDEFLTKLCVEKQLI